MDPQVLEGVPTVALYKFPDVVLQLVDGVKLVAALQRSFPGWANMSFEINSKKHTNDFLRAVSDMV